MQIVNLNVSRPKFGQMNILKASKNVVQNPENTSECNKDFVDKMNYYRSVSFKSINSDENTPNDLNNLKSIQDFTNTQVAFNGRVRKVRIGKWGKKVDVLKSKDEIQEIIKSEDKKIKSEKDISKQTNMIVSMVKNCFIDQGELGIWNPLMGAIRMDTYKAMQILEKILLADESRNKTVDELVKEMTNALIMSKTV